MLKYGSKGDQVEALQFMLVEIGLDPGPLNGQFNQRTLNAIKEFRLQYYPTTKHPPSTVATFADYELAVLKRAVKEITGGEVLP